MKVKYMYKTMQSSHLPHPRNATSFFETALQDMVERPKNMKLHHYDLFFWAVHQSRRGNINKGRKVNRSNTTISGYSHLRGHFISTSIALHCYFLSVISNRISYSVLDSLNHDQSYSFTAL